MPDMRMPFRRMAAPLIVTTSFTAGLGCDLQDGQPTLSTAPNQSEAVDEWSKVPLAARAIPEVPGIDLGDPVHIARVNGSVTSGLYVLVQHPDGLFVPAFFKGPAALAEGATTGTFVFKADITLEQAHPGFPDSETVAEDVGQLAGESQALICRECYYENEEHQLVESASTCIDSVHQVQNNCYGCDPEEEESEEPSCHLGSLEGTCSGEHVRCPLPPTEEDTDLQDAEMTAEALKAVPPERASEIASYAQTRSLRVSFNESRQRIQVLDCGDRVVVQVAVPGTIP